MRGSMRGSGGAAVQLPSVSKGGGVEPNLQAPLVGAAAVHQPHSVDVACVTGGRVCSGLHNATCGPVPRPCVQGQPQTHLHFLSGQHSAVAQPSKELSRQRSGPARLFGGSRTPAAAWFGAENGRPNESSMARSCLAVWQLCFAAAVALGLLQGAASPTTAVRCAQLPLLPGHWHAAATLLHARLAFGPPMERGPLTKPGHPPACGATSTLCGWSSAAVRLAMAAAPARAAWRFCSTPPPLPRVC